MKNLVRSFFGQAVAALCVVMPLALSPAMAFTPTGNKVADAFLAAAEGDDGKVESYGTVAETGDTVTIKDLVLTEPGSELNEARISSSTLTAGELQANGRLKLGELVLSGISVATEEGTLSIASFSATDLIVPTPEELAGGSGPGVVGPSYGTMEAQDIQIATSKGDKIAIGRLFMAIDEMSGDLPIASHFVIDALKVEADDLNENSRKALTDLGYEGLALNVEGQGRWDPETATIEVTDLKVSGKDAGTLAINLSLGDVTQDLVRQLNVLQDEPQKAMGLLQGVTIKSITIRLDNSSIIERILDMQAKEAGTDRDTVVQQLTAGMPMMVTILQNPELQNNVVEAMTLFLSNPVSLEITARPQSPVPISQILGQAMFAPQALPQILGMNISANDSN